MSQPTNLEQEARETGVSLPPHFGQTNTPEPEPFKGENYRKGYEAGAKAERERLVEAVVEELEIQEKVYKKFGEIVAFGRARVAGLVAEKYTRLGRIKQLQEIISLLRDK